MTRRKVVIVLTLGSLVALASGIGALSGHQEQPADAQSWEGLCRPWQTHD